MSIEIRWYDDEQTLLQVLLSSSWNWPEFEEAMSHGLEMIAPVGHTVHFLVEFDESTSRPKGNSLMHLKRVMQRANEHPLAGKSYLINPNPFARSIIDILLRVYKGDEQMRVVGSREEALRCIKGFAQEGAAGD